MMNRAVLVPLLLSWLPATILGQHASEPLGDKGELVRYRSGGLSCAFSNADSQLLLCSGDAARVFDFRSGEPVSPAFRHSGVMYNAIFSTDGTTVATCGADGTARLWDIRSGKLKIDPIQHGGSVRNIAFSRDGAKIGTVGDDRDANVWASQTGLRIVGPLKHHDVVLTIQFTPSGNEILTGDRSGNIILWSCGTGESLMNYRDGGGRSMLSPDGRLVAALNGRDVRIWQTTTGVLNRTIQVQNEVYAISFRGDSQALAVAASGFVQVFDVRTGEPICRALADKLVHDAYVATAFNSAGTLVMGVGESAKATIWNVASGERVADFNDGGNFTACAFSPDGTRAAASCASDSSTYVLTLPRLESKTLQ